MGDIPFTGLVEERGASRTRRSLGVLGREPSALGLDRAEHVQSVRRISLRVGCERGVVDKRARLLIRGIAQGG